MDGDTEWTLNVVRLSDIPDPALGADVPDGTTWGNWRYDKRWLVLEHIPNGYEVDLERCTTCTEILDWLCQLAGKRREVYSVEDLGHLLEAIDVLLNPQGTLCGSGVDRGKLDVKKYLLSFV